MIVDDRRLRVITCHGSSVIDAFEFRHITCTCSSYMYYRMPEIFTQGRTSRIVIGQGDTVLRKST